jgi:hypothetical protein
MRSKQDSLMFRTNLSAKAFKFGDRTGSRNGSTPAVLRISPNCSVKSVDRLAFGGQTTALVVIEARPLAQLLLEDSNLLLKIFDYELLAMIHPTSDANEQKA